MTVNLPSGVSVRYAFRYLSSDLDYHFAKTKDITQCIIYDPQTKKNISLGETKLNPADRPNRCVARKIAFGRAVNQFSENKFDREALWNSFLNHVRY